MQVYTGQVVEGAYRAHHGALVRHLTNVTRDPEVAQELAQEAFMRLARQVELNRAPDDAGAWLHRVGQNLAMSYGRHRQVVQRRAASLPQPAEPESPHHVVAARELTRALAQALGELSATERRALVLAANGFDGGEIAGSIGRSPGATRTLMCRARAKLREYLTVAELAPA